MTARNQEAAAFGIHMIKQVTYAFDRLDEIVDHAAPGSPQVAFYMNGIYDRLAAMFLLDRGNKPTGGFFSKVFPPLGMGRCLDEIHEILARNVGGLSLGETILKFRNKFLTHGELSDADLDAIYQSADMLNPVTMGQFHDGLHAIRDALPRLALCLVEKAGIDPTDVGMRLAP